MVNRIQKFVNRVIFLFFISLMFGCHSINVSENTKENIKHYLRIDVSLEQDTVTWGDEMVVTLIFENISDSTISFYPKANLVLDIHRETLVYGEVKHTAQFLSHFKDQNLDIVTTIEPHHFHTETYTIKIDDPLFEIGNNHLFIHYSCSKLSENRKKNNLLYGYLESSPFVVYVKDKQHFRGQQIFRVDTPSPYLKNVNCLCRYE